MCNRYVCEFVCDYVWCVSLFFFLSAFMLKVGCNVSSVCISRLFGLFQSFLPRIFKALRLFNLSTYISPSFVSYIISLCALSIFIYSLSFCFILLLCLILSLYLVLMPSVRPFIVSYQPLYLSIYLPFPLVYFFLFPCFSVSIFVTFFSPSLCFLLSLSFLVSFFLSHPVSLFSALSSCFFYISLFFPFLCSIIHEQLSHILGWSATSPHLGSQFLSVLVLQKSKNTFPDYLLFRSWSRLCYNKLYLMKFSVGKQCE